MQIRRILCAVDFSPPSREALHYASELARQYDAELVLLHVYQVPGYAFPEGVVLAGPEVVGEFLARIDGLMASWKEDAVGRGSRRVTTLVRQGVAAAEIVRVASHYGVDLVVGGTHGHTGLKHALIGSVAGRVVRMSPCPVLTVRASDHQFEAVRGP